MLQITLRRFILVVLLLGTLCGTWCLYVVRVRSESRAIAEIRRWGYTFLDELNPTPGVSFHGRGFDDAALGSLGRHLRAVRSLRALVLGGTGITDAGLTHVRALRRLRWLDLANTSVTDAGLQDLEDLTDLESLSLAGTDVSDAGLGHLKGLKKLRWLDLSNTKVTEAGVRGLQDSRQINVTWRGGDG